MKEWRIIPQDAGYAAVDAIRNLVDATENCQLGCELNHSTVCREDVAHILTEREEEDHDRHVEACTHSQADVGCKTINCTCVRQKSAAVAHDNSGIRD